MEPLLPEDREGVLRDLAVEVIRESAALGATIGGNTMAEIVPLLRTMNSYYSNLIEGHVTKPRDIERALANDWSTDPAKRAYQVEARAHVEVERSQMERVASDPDLRVTGENFLRDLHADFYRALPDDFRRLRSDAGREVFVVPGELRADEVLVGEHRPPPAATLPSFLRRFDESYGDDRLDAVARVIACAASHQRLLWIHPFVDGNGRVARLFTQAMLMRARVDAGGLWSMSRGLARYVVRYKAALADADASRRGPLDGRGNLSDEGLAAFCRFFLETAIDQIRYIRSLLALDSLQDRIIAFGRHLELLKQIPAGAGRVLLQAYVRDGLPRGEVRFALNSSERTATRVTSTLLGQGLLVSDGPRSALRLAFPTRAASFYFPDLFPVDPAEQPSSHRQEPS